MGDIKLIMWWIDDSFVIHHGMRCQSGAMMTLRKGAVASGLAKKRMNCKRSTDTEGAPVDDYMPKIM